MATSEEFFGETIDHTPYNTCAGVAIVVVIIFFGLAILLWNVAGWVKTTTRTWHFSLPTLALPSSADTIQKAKDAAQAQVKQQEDKAVQAAASAAATAASNQIDQTKKQTTQKLQDFLP